MKKTIIFISVFVIITLSFSCHILHAQTNKEPAPYRVGKWLPSDQAVLNDWMQNLINEVDNSNAELLPEVAGLKEMIERDPELYMYFNQMFEQVPESAKFKNDPTGKPQVRDYHHMLQLINHVMTKAPGFNKSGLVGFPINAILDWPMGTQAGTAVFLNDDVNAQIKKILNKWATFLGSTDSRYVLNDDPHTGWFGEDAQAAMPTFVDDFICDPSKPYYGFTSWDNFFTRQFREGKRPVASPIDNSIIANACESAPYRTANDVKLFDEFWIKAQPYSLFHIMDGDPLVHQFDGGTIYQAFLSALSYHRWHSPVSGKVVKTKLIGHFVKLSG